jgi:hypothetical protein
MMNVFNESTSLKKEQIIVMFSTLKVPFTAPARNQTTVYGLQDHCNVIILQGR